MKNLTLLGLLSLCVVLLGLNQDVQAQVSHQSWHSLLIKHVSTTGKVNYAGFKQDQAKLDAYLTLLAQNYPADSWSQKAQLAYWINAYNAFTVKLILNNYPLASIQDINQPWDQKFIKLGDRSLSLNDIEHGIIRKHFNEPRIHFAVNCASKSCPKLLNEAYTEARLNSQLEKQTKSFINNSSHNRLDPQKPQLSQLFDWYGDDFRKKGTLIEFINRYTNAPLQADAQISYLKYNWQLNS